MGRRLSILKSRIAESRFLRHFLLLVNQSEFLFGRIVVALQKQREVAFGSVLLSQFSFSQFSFSQCSICLDLHAQADLLAVSYDAIKSLHPAFDAVMDKGPLSVFVASFFLVVEPLTFGNRLCLKPPGWKFWVFIVSGVVFAAISLFILLKSCFGRTCRIDRRKVLSAIGAVLALGSIVVSRYGFPCISEDDATLNGKLEVVATIIGFLIVLLKGIEITRDDPNRNFGAALRNGVVPFLMECDFGGANLSIYSGGITTVGADFRTEKERYKNALVEVLRRGGYITLFRPTEALLRERAKQNLNMKPEFWKSQNATSEEEVYELDERVQNDFIDDINRAALKLSRSSQQITVSPSLVQNQLINEWDLFLCYRGEEPIGEGVFVHSPPEFAAGAKSKHTVTWLPALAADLLGKSLLVEIAPTAARAVELASAELPGTRILPREEDVLDFDSAERVLAQQVDRRRHPRRVKRGKVGPSRR